MSDLGDHLVENEASELHESQIQFIRSIGEGAADLARIKGVDYAEFKRILDDAYADRVAQLSEASVGGHVGRA